MTEPFWGIVSSNVKAYRGRHWYHVARIVRADGNWYELYWLPFDGGTRGPNKSDIRKACKVKLASGVWHQAPAPRNGALLERTP